MFRPKLSIITVCYNASSTIETTINSVLSQTYKNFEYLIIDGASADGTTDIIKKYTGSENVRYVSETDNGIFDAMNKGIELASGEWIYFLGSDDIFYDNNVVEKIFKHEINSVQIIYGNVKFLHSDIEYDGPFDQEKISTKNICHQALFTRKTLFQEIGIFDCKYKMSADYSFNLKWMGQKKTALYVDEIVAIYNEKGMSGRIWDEVFYNDFDNLLIENNIVSQRSFAFLKKKNHQLMNSYNYKAGFYIMFPLVWIKGKLKHWNK